MLTVGQILKPQGIRGEVKVKALTSDPSRFYVLKTVDIDGRPYRIKNVRINAGDVFLTLDGVTDRNGAEALRGKYLCIDRALAVELTDGEFFVADMIGAELYARSGETDTRVGVIERVDSYGAADVFTVSTDRGEMTFAFVKALMPVYDAESKRLTVISSALDGVAVYDED